MKFEEFYEMLTIELKKLDIENNQEKAKKLYDYMNLLIEWNKKINLTAIIEPKDIIIKHFIDSLTILKYIKKDNKIIDIGTGAGFPGIPIAIYKDGVKVTLVDSTNKKINFINEVKKEIVLVNIDTVCERAEVVGQNKNYREKFDIAVSRAVAPLNILVEYLLPLVKVNGECICMKGPNLEKELKNINHVIDKLGGAHYTNENIDLNGNNRNIIIINKIKNSSTMYPRSIGIPSKKPLN